MIGTWTQWIKSQWQTDRLGIFLVTAALAAITVVSMLFIRYQQLTDQAQTRTQGTKLIGVLSALTHEQLTGRPGRNALDLVFRSQGTSSNIAYAAVVTPQGQIVRQAAAEGVILPPVKIPGEPVYWHGERTLELPGTRTPILEYYAPVLNDTHLTGFIRLGYFVPESFLSWQQLPFIASVMLPVFLLAPFFYFMMRREIHPLTAMTRTFESLGDGRTPKLEVRASGQLGTFIEHLNLFIERTQQQHLAYENEQVNLEAATRVLNYNRCRLENVLNALPQAIVVLDKSGATRFASNKLASLLDLDPDTLIGQPFRNWCPQEALLAQVHEQTSCSMTSPRSEAIEFPGTHNNNTLAATVQPVADPDDPHKMTGTVVIFSDNTSNKLAQASRSTFVGHVAHELKTPLHVLSLYSESLLSPDLTRNNINEAANVIHDEVGRLNDLINNLLNITKIEMGSLGIDRERVKIRDLVEDCIKLARHNANENHIRIDFQAPKEASAISADKNLLRIALNNLLTNAVKYNKPNGHVSVELAEFDESIEITIKDTGIGLEPGELTEIFERFYRSERDEVRARPGHGLGLALTKDIIDLHGGRIKALSEPGKGATFIIELVKNKAQLNRSAHVVGEEISG